MEKTTNELLNEIKSSEEIDQYLCENSGELNSKTLSERIDEIIKEKGLKKPDIVARSSLNRIYTYQILQGKRIPSRDKLIALCFGMELDLEETNKLLCFAGYSPLYARDKRDSIVIFSIKEGNNIFRANEMLLEHGFRILTA